MKITIIGPVYPYKGGISHYTSLMAKNLMKEHEVNVISFKKQYPKILYKRPQKDFENDSFKLDNVKYIINSINLFSGIKTAKIIDEQTPDIIIFQWWHPFFSFIYWFILKSLRKKTKRNCKTIFLCHNVLPHEKFPLQEMLTRCILLKGDAYIIHSHTDEENLYKLIKSPVFIRTVIPTYNAFNMNEISGNEARTKLGIYDNNEILLFFGYIREYKGLKNLIRAMPLILEKRPNALLLIAGDFFENNKDEYLQLIDTAKCQNNIILYDGYIPDKEVGIYFTACDLVVCPYESATQSAVVQVAYGFGKPVVATDVGGLSEVVTAGKTGYLIPVNNERALASAITDFFELDDDIQKEYIKNIENEAFKYSWDRMNEVVADVLNKLRGK